MYFVVCYDIQDDKKRNKLSLLLNKYGKKVQYSVYELTLNKTQLKSLTNAIKSQKLFSKNDSIRFYHIHLDSIKKSFELSFEKKPFEEEELSIFFED